MLKKIMIIFTFIINGGLLWSQNLSYTPELVLGHRSHTYQHFINYNLNHKVSINNLALFDSEYKSDDNNIFFIRNTLSIKVLKNVSANFSVGIKNPGTFTSIFLNYFIKKPNFSIRYSLGSTYQEGFILDQNFLAVYTPNISKDIKGYIHFLIIASFDSKVYQRGIQQLKIGVQKEKLQFGIAGNFDQFNNASKTLENIGIFIKYNF